MSSCSSSVLEPVSTNPRDFGSFWGVLLQALVHSRCLSLYQQTLGTLVVFGDVLPQALFHPRCLSLYQQTLEFLVHFEAAQLQVCLPPFFSFCELSPGFSASFFICFTLSLYAPPTFLTQYFDIFFDPHL